MTLQDGTQPLNNSSVQVSFDGAPVTPTIQKSGLTTTVTYDPPGLLASTSVHSYRIAYNNLGGATPNTTNEYSFTVAAWANVNLGTPIHLETFDGLAEGALPIGWSVQNFTDADPTPGLDLNNVLSDSYTNWVVISRSRLVDNIIVTNPADFASTLNVAPNQVINGSLVTNLITGNFIWAVSDRADGQKQVQYLFTGDYNLSGKTDVYLSFKSIYQQNQDSMGSVEYSIDNGATWLPALYMLDQPDIIVGTGGVIDASNTLATIRGDVPDLDGGTLGNGYYGRYIGVAQSQWANLGPFISGRVNDDPTGSQRVEILRLAQADNQPAVRFRFAQVGTWSWYFGMDDFGLYSLTVVSPPVLATGPTPANLPVAYGNSATLTIANPSGQGPFSYQWRKNGTDLAGKTTQTLSLDNVNYAAAGSYDVVVSNAGGSTTSPPPAAVVTVINPAVFVTGQWNFDDQLKAFYGRDLEYFDAMVGGDTTFGTTTSFGIPDIDGQPAPVMRLIPSVPQWGGYKMYHGASPNGGGAYVNQYTLVYDIFLPYQNWRSLLQTATGNGNDGDIFLNTTGGIGISGIYNGTVTEQVWHRVAVAIDLSGPGQFPVLTKFIDGVKVGNQTTGLSDKDGRFALDPFALLFADNDGRPCGYLYQLRPIQQRTASGRVHRGVGWAESGQDTWSDQVHHVGWKRHHNLDGWRAAGECGLGIWSVDRG